jgi:hypothetical protein
MKLKQFLPLFIALSISTVGSAQSKGFLQVHSNRTDSRNVQNFLRAAICPEARGVTDKCKGAEYSNIEFDKITPLPPGFYVLESAEVELRNLVEVKLGQLTSVQALTLSASSLRKQAPNLKYYPLRPKKDDLFSTRDDLYRWMVTPDYADTDLKRKLEESTKKRFAEARFYTACSQFYRPTEAAKAGKIFYPDSCKDGKVATGRWYKANASSDLKDFIDVYDAADFDKGIRLNQYFNNGEVKIPADIDRNYKYDRTGNILQYVDLVFPGYQTLVGNSIGGYEEGEPLTLTVFPGKYLLRVYKLDGKDLVDSFRFEIK